MASLPAKSFLGIGWAFPVSDYGGQTVLAAYEEDVRQAILIILLTNENERVMRPEFGAGLNAFLFEPINPTTMESLRRRVETALIDWESRIDVVSVLVVQDPKRLGGVVIDITYRVRATNTIGNLVYPFYLGEGTAK
jgi:phage baseplate assembly protein W